MTPSASMKRKRGRPPIKRDFSDYWVNRTYKERRAAIVARPEGRPKGIKVALSERTMKKLAVSRAADGTLYQHMVDVKYPTVARLNTGMLALKVEGMLEQNPALTRRLALLQVLTKELARIDAKDGALFLLPTAIRAVNRYRKTHPWEF